MIRSWNAIWFRVLTAMALVVVAIWFMGRTDKPSADNAAGMAQDLMRAAYGITMQDVDVVTGKTTVIKAAKMLQRKDEVVFLYQVELDQADKVHLIGDAAVYDIRRSLLDLTGNVVLTTKDGMRGAMQNLTWDRKAGRAWTNQPVRFSSKDGAIVAQQAETLNDFDDISLLGGVYVKIAGGSFGRDFPSPFSATGS